MHAQGAGISRARCRRGCARRMRTPRCCARRGCARRAGAPRRRRSGQLLPAAQLAGQLRHQRTVRGHRFAVYCIAFDQGGRRLITGSDDRLVKVLDRLRPLRKLLETNLGAERHRDTRGGGKLVDESQCMQASGLTHSMHGSLHASSQYSK